MRRAAPGGSGHVVRQRIARGGEDTSGLVPLSLRRRWFRLRCPPEQSFATAGNCRRRCKYCRCSDDTLAQDEITTARVHLLTGVLTHRTVTRPTTLARRGRHFFRSRTHFMVV